MPHFLKHIFLATLLSIMCQAKAEGASGMKSNLLSGGTLEAAIMADKTSCRVGDTIRFSCILTNKTEGEVRILSTRRYSAHWIRVVDSNGQSMRDSLSVIIDWNETLQSNEVVVLKPGASFRKDFKARVIQGEKHDLSRGGKLRGLFLDFEDSAILLAGTGTYSITAHFEGRSGRRHPKIWKGTVESKPITLKVEVFPHT